MSSVNKPLITVAAICAVAATVLGLYVAGHPYIPADVTIEDDIQSINWGPLALSFRSSAGSRLQRRGA